MWRSPKQSRLRCRAVSRGAWTEYAGNPVFDPISNRAYYPTVAYDAAAFSHAQGDVISASLPYTYQVTPYYKMWVATGAGAAGIQFAYSNDGISWYEFNNGAALPGLYPTGYHSFVLYDTGGFGTSHRYKVWYWSGIMSYAVGDIRTAESVDGIAWENDQPLTQEAAMPIVTGLGVGWNRAVMVPITSSTMLVARPRSIATPGTTAM